MHRSPRLLPVAIAGMAGLIAALLPAADARVNARLELRNVPSDKRLNCRYAAVINTSRAGERTCETTPQPTLARGWTGDGTVAYDARNGTRVRRLRGSPSV